MIIVNPCYFGPIALYSSILKHDSFTFEVSDNYQKQSYRNRCNIANSNGLLSLNIPIKHTWSTHKPPIKEVLIDNTENWQKQHLRSLKIAYSSSPFFEYYLDDLKPIFEKKFSNLLDLNLESHRIVMSMLDEKRTTKYTKFYSKYTDFDYRDLVLAKAKNKIQLPRYIQLFEQKHGFLSNLSILDLIFMEGPSSTIYLNKCTIPKL